MCHISCFKYSCFPACQTGKYMRLARCELFCPTKNPFASPNDKCTGKDGRKTTFQVLCLPHRCPNCVKQAVAARVAERKDREEREKDAERRGERGEVARELRMEEDEDGIFPIVAKDDDSLTPKVKQHELAGVGSSAEEDTPQLLVETEGEVGLGIYF